MIPPKLIYRLLILILTLVFSAFEVQAADLNEKGVEFLDENIRPDPRVNQPFAVTGEVAWEEARKFWAFQTPRLTKPPVVKDSAWPQSDVDRFVLARLEEHGLHPVSLADSGALVRRVYFDLIGLPPTLEEVNQFLQAVKGNRTEATRQLVNRLLDSPHYGERWGRHWLDVARYAWDQAHTYAVAQKTSAHQYRDWVIMALNNDMPYDEFVKRQLAGDLMPETIDQFASECLDKAADPAKFLRLAGLGFLGLGADYFKVSDPERALAEELDDRIDTLTRGFLGLTVACARCHDHKFDPIPTRDYYALAGIFNGSKLGDMPLVTQDIVARYDAGQTRVRQQDERIKSWCDELRCQRTHEAMSDTVAYITTAWRVYVRKWMNANDSLSEIATEEELSHFFLESWVRYLAPKNTENVVSLLQPWFEIAEQYSKTVFPGNGVEFRLQEIAIPDEIRQLAHSVQQRLLSVVQEHNELEQEYEQALADADDNAKKKIQKSKLPTEKQDLLTALWLDDGAPFYAGQKATEQHLLTEPEKNQLAKMRAELDRRKKASPPMYPVAHVLQGDGSPMQIYIRGSYANKGEWTAKGFLQILGSEPSPDDPKLVQQRQFTRLNLAEAIVSPNNPLTARVIVNRVWQHHFGRGIVASASNFGHLGERPTHPQLLDWLTVRFIANGWSLKWLHREILLSATYSLSSDSDLSNQQFDPENHYLWRMSRRRLDVESWRDALLAVSDTLDCRLGGPMLDLSAPDNRRRTVYAQISRHQLDSLLRMFDFPDANVTSALRSETTVPQQQLFVLNSEFFINQAKAFAERIQKSNEDEVQRIRNAYQVAYGRLPTDEEEEVGLEFLSSPADVGNEDKLSHWQQYAQALLAANEFMYVD